MPVVRERPDGGAGQGRGQPSPSLAGTGATSPSAEPARPVATPTQSFPAGSQTGPAATAQPTPSTTQAAGARSPEILSPPRTPSPNANLTFSHESQRYLLGYTPQYYGVWDKSAPGPPVKRFPRTDQGWQQAWEAFIRAEMDAE